MPSYQEEENIGTLLKDLLDALPQAHIVVVDDSPDLLTVDAVARCAHPQVSCIHREAKGGRGSAVLAGMARLILDDVERIVEIDADSSHQISELRALLRTSAEGNWDLVIASRYAPGSRIINWPWGRRIFSRYANLLTRTVLGVPITDYTNGYRVYSRRAAEVVVRHCGRIGKGFISLSEILVQLYCRGYTICETPSTFVNRVRGQSAMNHAEIWNAAIGLARIFALKRRLERELRAR